LISTQRTNPTVKESKLFFVDNVTKVTEKQLNIRKKVGLNLSQSIISEERDNKDLLAIQKLLCKNRPCLKISF